VCEAIVDSATAATEAKTKEIFTDYEKAETEAKAPTRNLSSTRRKWENG
jgi:hypothetical protein